VAVSPTASHRTASRTIAALVGIAAVMAVVLMPSPASAEPTSAQLKAQIDAQNKVLEPIIEQYNGLRAHIAEDKVRASKISAQIAPAQKKASAAQDRINDIVSTIYQHGPATHLQVVFATDSTTDLVEMLSSMGEVAHEQSREIAKANKDITDFHSQRVRLDQLLQQENTQYKQLVAQKADIQTKVDNLQKLLNQAQAAEAKAAAAKAAADKAAAANYKYTKAELMPKPCPVVSSTGKGHTAAVKACSLVWDTSHKPPYRMYGWAEAGPDEYDCSGLTQAAWAAAGIHLIHYTGDQWNQSYAISESALRPGDLVFYFQAHSHVALYVGDGWIVQAEQTGEPLKMSKMTFESPRYYRRVNGT